MKNGFESHHYDTENKPDGGVTFGAGFTISWQRGALRNDDGTFKRPNGAFIEDIIDAAKDRLEYHQRSQSASEENAQARRSKTRYRYANALLTQALEALDSRTKRREATGRLGYQEVDNG